MKQHTLGNTQDFPKVLIHKGPNEIIETRFPGLKAAKSLKFLSIAVSGIERTLVTNLPDEFDNTVCHYVKGICSFLNLGFGKQAV